MITELNQMGVSLEEFLVQLPGAVYLKEVRDEKSYYTWCTDESAKLVGFNSIDHLVGLSDEEINCEAAKGAETFYQHDYQVWNGETIQTLDLYKYSDNSVIGLLGTKKPLRNIDGEVVAIIAVGLHLTKSVISKLGGCTQNNTYVIKESIKEFGLTQRESECFYYLLHGYSAKKIALIMQISYRTIENHIYNLKAKMNVDNKSQLFELAFESNLLHFIPASICKLNLTTIT